MLLAAAARLGLLGLPLHPPPPVSGPVSPPNPASTYAASVGGGATVRRSVGPEAVLRSAVSALLRMDGLRAVAAVGLGALELLVISTTSPAATIHGQSGSSSRSGGNASGGEGGDPSYGGDGIYGPGGVTCGGALGAWAARLAGGAGRWMGGSGAWRQALGADVATGAWGSGSAGAVALQQGMASSAHQALTPDAGRNDGDSFEASEGAAAVNAGPGSYEPGYGADASGGVHVDAWLADGVFAQCGNGLGSSASHGSSVGGEVSEAEGPGALAVRVVGTDAANGKSVRYGKHGLNGALGAVESMEGLCHMGPLEVQLGGGSGLGSPGSDGNSGGQQALVVVLGPNGVESSISATKKARGRMTVL